MNTLAFFEKVLPSQGTYLLAEFHDGLKQPPRHSIHKSLASLAARVAVVDSHGLNVFHACQSYAPNAEGRYRRKAENAAFFRSLYIDLDVGEGKPYASQREAAAALAAACSATGLPAPMMLSSGRGLHCYWPLDTDVPTKEYWHKFAGRLHTALTTHGVQVDSSVTMDAARILRPIGSHHRKGDPKPVRLLFDNGPFDVRTMVDALKQFKPPAPKVVDTGINNDLAISVEYPPSSVTRIIQFCPTLKHISDTGGDVSEPLWRAGLGLIKHTVEGEPACHALSEGHPAYDAEETQRKIDNWTAGPTTCAQFRGCEGNKCGDCTRAVKSPIHLGYAEVAEPPAALPEEREEQPEAEVSPAAELGDLPEDDQKLVGWPKQSHHRKLTLMVGEQKIERAVLSRIVPGEPGEPPTHVPFSHTFIMPVGRIQVEDGTWDLRCIAYVGGKMRKFIVPGAKLASGDLLAPVLQQYEINVLPKKGELMRQHLIDGREALAEANIYSKTYKSFGWTEDHGVDTFVIGTLGIQPDRTLEIIPAQSVQSVGWAREFPVRGSQPEYTRLINEIYNRPGAELFQFVLMAAYGAPLVALTDSTTWNGIPIALTGDTSSGKTTLCALACSIYGSGEIFTQPANRAGTTTLALYARAGILSNLPFVMDELTDTESEQCSDLLYALSNGRPRDRCNSAGMLVRQTERWRTISYITSQRNLTELLAQQANSAITDATQVRIFEIRLPQSLSMHVFKGVDREKVETDFMSGQYGLMGRLWLQYLVKHKAEVAERLRANRRRYKLDTSDTRKERFYFDLISTVITAAEVTKDLGWHDFDVDAIRQWAEENVNYLRGERKEHAQHADVVVDGFLRSLHGYTAVTKGHGDDRGSSEFSQVDLRGAPLCRISTTKKTIVVLVSALQRFCKDMGYDYQQVHSALVERNIILMPPPNADRAQKNRSYRAYPFRGVSGVVSSQSMVFRLDFNLWNGGGMRAGDTDDSEAAA